MKKPPLARGLFRNLEDRRETTSRRGVLDALAGQRIGARFQGVNTQQPELALLHGLGRPSTGRRTMETTTPTGRRRLTPGQLHALSYPPPRSDGPSRGQVLSMMKKAAPLMGLRPGLVTVIDILFSVSSDIDWQGEGRPIVWYSNRRLQELAGVGRTQMKAILSQLFEAGLIAMRDSGDGHRRGRREDGDGRIVQAFGIDLSPLAARHEEFAAVVEEDAQQRELAQQLRREISATKRAILTLADRGQAEGGGTVDWPAMTSRARQLATGCASQRDTDVLGMVTAQLQTLHLDAEAGLQPQSGADLLVESDPAGSENRPRNTTTTELTITDAYAETEGRSRPAAHEAWQSNRRATDPTPNQTADQVDALRKFPATPDFVMWIASQFRDFASTSRPTQTDIVEAAWHVRKHLGVSPGAWGEACVTLGRWPAAVAIAAIAARHEAGEVRSPGGLLRRMVQLFERGELRLDRTLYGLAD